MASIQTKLLNYANGSCSARLWATCDVPQKGEVSLSLGQDKDKRICNSKRPSPRKKRTAAHQKPGQGSVDGLGQSSHYLRFSVSVQIPGQTHTVETDLPNKEKQTPSSIVSFFYKHVHILERILLRHAHHFEINIQTIQTKKYDRGYHQDNTCSQIISLYYI